MGGNIGRRPIVGGERLYYAYIRPEKIFGRQKIAEAGAGSAPGNYHFIKLSKKLENYLSAIKNAPQRRYLTKLRISNHKLQIEYGRYQKLPREERICKSCDIGIVEDE